MAIQSFEKTFDLSGDNVEGRIYVTEDSYSTANNSSTITVLVQVHRTNSGNSTYGSGTVSGTVNGTSYSQSISSSTKVTSNTWVTFFSKSYTISHSSDGSKKITVTANISWQRTGSSSLSCTLTTIPRASSITSASSVELGKPCSITWTPNSSSFRYKIKLSLGSWSNTTDEYISPQSTSAYTYTGYTIPLEVANQLPKSTNGTMTAALYTYNGSTQVGSASTKTFTVTVPNTVLPTISSFSVAVDNSANEKINEWEIGVAGYSKAILTAKADGSYGSTISSFVIGGAYSTTQTGTSLSYTGSALSGGSNKFTVVAKDTRGRSSVVSEQSVYVLSYAKPIVSLRAGRNSSDAANVTVNAGWVYCRLSDKNSLSVKLEYKERSSGAWITYSDNLTGTNTESDIFVTGNVSLTLTEEFNESSSYDFRVTATDALGNSAQCEASISTADVLLDFRAGGKGLGIGKIAESDSLEVALDAKFMGTVYIYSKDDDEDGGKYMTLAEYIKSIVETQ